MQYFYMGNPGPNVYQTLGSRRLLRLLTQASPIAETGIFSAESPQVKPFLVKTGDARPSRRCKLEIRISKSETISNEPNSNVQNRACSAD